MAIRTGRRRAHPFRRLHLVGPAATVAVVAVLALMPIGAQGRQVTPYRLDPVTGCWFPLPPINPFASVEALDPVSGRGTAGAASIGVSITARLEPDPPDPPGSSGVVFNVNHVLRSREIVLGAPRVFLVPTGRRLEWTLTVEVRNGSPAAITGAVVQDTFGSQFQALVATVDVGTVRITPPTGLGLLRPAGGSAGAAVGLLRWEIGTLEPGARARLEVTLRTPDPTGGGHPGIRAPGTYLLSGGARLSFTSAGRVLTQFKAPVLVVARGATHHSRLSGLAAPTSGLPGGGGGEGDGSGQVPPAGGAPSPVVRAAQLRGARSMNLITETAVPDTPNVTQNPDGSFNGPVGEVAGWLFTITVHNPGPSDWTSASVLDTFGLELSLEAVDPAPPGLTVDGSLVTWYIGPLAAGASASATLRLRTKVTARGQEYAVAGLYSLNSGGLLTCDAGPASAPPLEVHAGPWASYSLSGTRVDWRVRHPGSYAAQAARIHVEGSGWIRMRFAGFEDLTCAGGASKNTIDTYYGFGQTLAVVESAGWVRATDMASVTLGPWDIFAPGVDVNLWSRISVSGQNPSAEYEDEGVITLLLSNLGP